MYVCVWPRGGLPSSLPPVLPVNQRVPRWSFLRKTEAPGAKTNRWERERKARAAGNSWGGMLSLRLKVILFTSSWQAEREREGIWQFRKRWTGGRGRAREGETAEMGRERGWGRTEKDWWGGREKHNVGLKLHKDTKPLTLTLRGQKYVDTRSGNLCRVNLTQSSTIIKLHVWFLYRIFLLLLKLN